MGSMVPKAHKEYTVHSATMLRCGERTDLNARPAPADRLRRCRVRREEAGGVRHRAIRFKSSQV